MSGSQIDGLEVDESPLDSPTSTLQTGSLTVDDPDALGLEDAPLDAIGDIVGPDWMPTLEDVAALMPEATRGKFLGNGNSAGAEQGIFGPTTGTTDQTVEGYIVAACREVIGRVGVRQATLDLYGDLANTTAAWYVVMLIRGKTTTGRQDDADGSVQTATRQYLGNLEELQRQARRGKPRLI